MKDGEVVIRFGARAAHGGWLPLLVVNGRERVQWWPGAFDKATALRMAESYARQEAARYVGDWDISVSAVSG